MTSVVKKLLCGLMVIPACANISYATEMLGNPTDIGTPGQLELLVGGGRTTDLSLAAGKSTGNLHIGSASATFTLPASAGNFNDEQIFFGLSYAFNAKTQLFANFGSGKNSEQSTKTNTVGLKLSPQTETAETRMGIVLRAQQVTMDIEGPFYVPPSSINDGTNTSYFGTALNGTEQIKYTRMDAFIGASRNIGTFRPYGGFCLTRISGTDTISLNDTVNVSSFPNAGGTGSTTMQQVSFNAKSNISGNKNFTAVFGLGINPNNDIGIVSELQFGVQRSVSMSGNFRF